MVSTHYTENSFVVIFPFKYFVGTDKAICLIIHFVLSELLVSCLLTDVSKSWHAKNVMSISKTLSSSIASGLATRLQPELKLQVSQNISISIAI
jgi:hypothetical protein